MMHSTFQKLIRTYINTRSCKKLSTTAVCRNNNVESTNAEEALVNGSGKIVFHNDTPHGIMNILTEVTKNGTEKDAEFIVQTVAKNLKDYNIRLTAEYAAEIRKNYGCQYMFNTINNNIRSLSNRRIVETLVLLKKFHVPQKTIIAQNTLAMISASMNDLYISEIIAIAKLMVNYQETPLARAIMSALPKVFKLKIRTEMDTSDLNEVLYVFKNSALLGWTENHETLIKILSSKIKKLTSNEALSIHFGLCRQKQFSDLEYKLLRYTEGVLNLEKDLLTFENVQEVLNSVKLCSSLRNQAVYDPYFIEGMCRHIIKLNPKLADLVTVVYPLYALSHVSHHLLEHLEERWQAKELRLLSPATTTTCLLHFVSYFSMANYTPKHWNKVKELILEASLECSPKELISFVLNLIALDCFHPKLMERVFDMDIPLESQLHFLSIYRAVRILYPNTPLPQANVLEKIDELCAQDIYKPQTIMEKILDGPKYVRNGLKTKVGHVVDHTLLLSEYQNFIPFNNDIESSVLMEDLTPPANCQLVFVLTFPKSAYQANTESLKGIYYLRAKCIKKLTKYPVVMMNSKYLGELSRSKLESHVQRMIKEKGSDFLSNYTEEKLLDDTDTMDNEGFSH